MIWKVCGMRDRENIEAILGLKPNLMGFIFYPKSKRYVGENPQILRDVDFRTTGKVGVFVNEPIDSIQFKADAFGLDFLQLHGDEDIDYVRQLAEDGRKIIRVARIGERMPVDQLREEQEYVQYFLFDTQTSAYGGSGRVFDWRLLGAYQLERPFLLSGGLGHENINEVLQLDHTRLAGIDVNSKYEIAPALKNVEMIKELANTIK